MPGICVNIICCGEGGQDMGPVREEAAARVAPALGDHESCVPLCHFLYFCVFLEFSIIEVKKEKGHSLGLIP